MFIEVLIDVKRWKSYGLVCFEDETPKVAKVKTLTDRVDSFRWVDWDSTGQAQRFWEAIKKRSESLSQ